MNGITRKIIESWACTEHGINSTDELLAWIGTLNKTTYVDIKECSISDSNFWFYDDYNGEVLNRKRSFFSIQGMRYFVDGLFIREQPIIIQPEIGYLGIICKEINGVLHFLMQAKIEPGNINCVQISPTIQATKSNFTRVHGGRLPLYFEYFEHAEKYQVLFDQVQSEQAARFYQKRNRNMILLIDDELSIYSNFKWMTLGQIKFFMEIDNLVNMDTRTVLSGILPAVTELSEKEYTQLENIFIDKALYQSIFKTNPMETLPEVFQKVNNFKMFHDIVRIPVPLNQLLDWSINEYGITCRNRADFMVRYYDIEIHGREVQKWTQPLFKAIGSATFGLMTKQENGIRKFLIKIKPEIGSFDKVELGPTIQWEATHYLYNDDDVEKVFRKHVENKENILCDVILSEEGGRFYHEQNRNIIIEIDDNELDMVPEMYIWVEYSVLSYLVQVNNCLNIQLRNLMSLIKL